MPRGNMQEPTKGDVWRMNKELQQALYIAQRGREQAERRLVEIGRLLNAPHEEPDFKSNSPISNMRHYDQVVSRARKAAKAEGRGLFS